MCRGATLAFFVAATATFSAADASPGVVSLEPAASVQTRIVLASADQCRAAISAYGKASGYAPHVLKRQLARMRAVSDWRSKVKQQHGSGFTTWRTAQDRNIQCDTSLGALHCVAEARPCNGPTLGSIF